ncbi:MAG: hypothetical protein MI974_07615 [Chitinophagales bacterium]|nr:hypothetical protein [Chitinophagales bacterium]
MTSKEFRAQIEKILEGLTKKQKVQFAWRCAVRSLPYLGNRGHFGFWEENKKSTHLYSVLYALDLTSSDVSFTTTDSAAAASAASAASAVAFSSAPFSASPAAYTAAYAAAYASNAAAAAVYAFASSSASSSFSAAAAVSKDSIIKSRILEDANAIKTSNYYKISIDDYGEVWENFQKALKSNDCEYWAKLYEDIFTNNFQLDPKALERRLNVPEEIRKQGAVAVGHYLRKLEKGAKRLNQARVIILGDKGAGKTCLARRLAEPDAPMTTVEESTAGVDTSFWEIGEGEEAINVNIWDFAGHTVTHAVHQFFLSERCLYIMVYDGRTEKRNNLVYWLNHMKNYGGNSSAIILINRRDQHKVELPINVLKEQYPIIDLYDFSIKKDREALETFRSDVASYIKNNPSWKRQDIPTSYYKVKEELQNLFHESDEEQPQEHIPMDTFQEIARRHEVEDVEQLLKDLHALGISLWYKNIMDFDSLILNPEWISHGVYKIINWASNHSKHELGLRDFNSVFEAEKKRYPDRKCYEFLFNLIKYYELAYERADKPRLIIPHLLKEDRPQKLPDFPVGESLKIQYKADQPLPPNTISRFIVRHNQQIRNKIVWRYGVVLENGKGSIALVREEDRSISVSVRGSSKSDYIVELRATLNDIFNSYKSKKPELHYWIKEYGEIRSALGPNSKELWLSENKIVNHHAANMPYYDDVTGEQLQMEKVVNLYKIENSTVFWGSQVENFTHNTFNFQDCNINLQGQLNDLAQSLVSNGHEEEAKRLEGAAALLEKVENAENPKEVKKKGVANRLKRIVEDLGDEDSKLYKIVSGLEHGVEMAQNIGRYYNDIAQWVGMPQIPKPLLGKKEE